MGKRMGEKQESIMQALRMHTRWYDGCEWSWQSPARTVALLESLRKRGKVVRTVQGTGSAVYTPAPGA